MRIERARVLDEVARGPVGELVLGRRNAARWFYDWVTLGTPIAIGTSWPDPPNPPIAAPEPKPPTAAPTTKPPSAAPEPKPPVNPLEPGKPEKPSGPDLE